MNRLAGNRGEIIYHAAKSFRDRHGYGAEVTVESIADLAIDVCEAMMSDPQTIARALMNLTPEQRAEVLVLYDKLASLGV
jgi:hypothetical protein